MKNIHDLTLKTFERDSVLSFMINPEYIDIPTANMRLYNARLNTPLEGLIDFYETIFKEISASFDGYFCCWVLANVLF